MSRTVFAYLFFHTAFLGTFCLTSCKNRTGHDSFSALASETVNSEAIKLFDRCLLFDDKGIPLQGLPAFYSDKRSMVAHIEGLKKRGNYHPYCDLVALPKVNVESLADLPKVEERDAKLFYRCLLFDKGGKSLQALPILYRNKDGIISHIESVKHRGDYSTPHCDIVALSKFNLEPSSDLTAPQDLNTKFFYQCLLFNEKDQALQGIPAFYSSKKKMISHIDSVKHRGNYSTPYCNLVGLSKLYNSAGGVRE